MGIVEKLLPVGILYVITVGFGLWVSRIGRPYNVALFNIHKLVALGAVVLAGVRIIKMDPFVEFSQMVIILISVAVVGVVSMFAAGALMSIKEEESRLALAIHQAASVLITITMIWAVYFSDDIQLLRNFQFDCTRDKFGEGLDEFSLLI
jgi:ABC-type cobalamin transport system permease subunit